MSNNTRNICTEKVGINPLPLLYLENNSVAGKLFKEVCEAKWVKVNNKPEVQDWISKIK